MRKACHWLSLLALGTLTICGCGGGGGASGGTGGSSGQTSGTGNNGSTAPSTQTVTVEVQIPGLSRSARSGVSVTRSIADVTEFKVSVTDKAGNSLASATAPYAYPQAAVSITCAVPPGQARQFNVSGLDATGQVQFSGTTMADVTAGMGPVTVAVQSPTSTVAVGGTVIDPSKPAGIVYDSVPAYGSWGVPLLGHTLNVLPNTVKTVTYILVAGTWWVKPYAAGDSADPSAPFTSVNSDGTFSVDITTGGIDEDATTVKTWLVISSFPAPSENTPPPDPAPGNGVLAVVSANR